MMLLWLMNMGFAASDDAAEADASGTRRQRQLRAFTRRRRKR